MLSQLGGHDVGGIRVGDGDEGLGPVGAGSPENVFIDRGAKNHLTRKVLSEAIEGGFARIDDRHLVPLLAQQAGQIRPNPAAADDDRSHISPKVFYGRILV